MAIALLAASKDVAGLGAGRLRDAPEQDLRGALAVEMTWIGHCGGHDMTLRTRHRASPTSAGHVGLVRADAG